MYLVMNPKSRDEYEDRLKISQLLVSSADHRSCLGLGAYTNFEELFGLLSNASAVVLAHLFYFRIDRNCLLAPLVLGMILVFTK